MPDSYKNIVKNQPEKTDIPWKEIVFKVKDGRQIPVRHATNVLHEKGEFMGIVNFFQDLTEIKQLEGELVQSERLAAVGQTVSGLAHYVKNILIGLKGGSYVVDVGMKKNDTEKLKTGWQTIKNNINRVADLTQDLLTYSKDRQPEIEPCFPNEIVEDVIDLVSNVASSNNIRLLKEIDPDIGELDVDPQTIHRTLLNLVNNAMDACVEDENTSKEFEIQIKTYVESNNMLCLEVKDNGCGMDEETRARLFDPMFSTKGGKGTGLGLLVTAKLVEEHKGIIDTKTRLGQGTTFVVRLPFGKVDAVDRN